MSSTVRPHAFVVMPFGTKEGIDFDAVYADLIRPSLAEAGFEAFRADEEARAGDIRADMFQELLLADLVVADLSIDNPNAWYELGVRHALRARGVVHIRGARDYMPFDVAVDRSLRYHLADGRPDPAHLESDRAALATMVRQTAAAWRGHASSPVYGLVPGLREPDWQSLRVAGASEFWDLHEAWEHRLEIARGEGRVGDVLLLAEEAPTWATRLEARSAAAAALQRLGSYAFALEQTATALEIDPDHRESLERRVILLGRSGALAAAREHADRLRERFPVDPDAAGLRARLDKEAWVAAWEAAAQRGDDPAVAAADECSLLLDAASAYADAFRLDPRHYWSGVNAASLGRIYEHLAGEPPGISDYDALRGGVEWAARADEARAPRAYWPRATLAELALTGAASQQAVERAFGRAIAAEDVDWFRLDSTRQQVDLFVRLGIAEPGASAAAGVLQRGLDRVRGPRRPRLVLLFSGHMVDAPGRPAPRFPPALEPAVARTLAERLSDLGAGPEDTAITSAAAGGDLLFLEACLERGVPCVVHLPFDEPAFIERSVAFAGDRWRDRYFAATRNPLTSVRVLTADLGPEPPGASSFERCNLWQLFTALGLGADRVRFTALWDGRSGDGPGGTAHMVEAVRARSGQVAVVDPATL